jgi:hypothetical protein
MSLVILVLGIIFCWTGVDDDGGVFELDAELDNVDEKVLLRSILRRTIINKSSRNFFEDASVRPESSYLIL